jgi:hypothetical protein
VIVIEDSLFFQTAQAGTEGLAFDGGQYGVARGEFGKRVNVFRIEVFIFLGECRKTEHRQVIGCILN